MAQLHVQCMQGGLPTHLDGKTRSFLVDSLRLKDDFTLTVDQTAPPIPVTAQQVLHGGMLSA